MQINELIQLYSILIFISVCALFVGLFAVFIFRHFKRVHYIKQFSEYRAVLEYNMEKAYDMIHKEHILTYSLDAFRIKDEDFDKISQEFVKLLQKFIGPVLLKEYINFYGDEDTFIFVVLEFFGTKYENDEIRNTAMEQITEAEVDEQD